MERKRLPTGVTGLDPLLNGGFVQGKSYLVTGDSGTGKTIFCMQFVWKGLLDGEKAVYVAVDEKPADIVDAAASLGWDLAKYIDQKNLLILDASPYFSARAGQRDKDLDVAKTVSDLAAYVKRMEATRVVIDPVGPFLISRETGRVVQDYARILVHALHEKLSTTNLLTSYVPGTGGDHNEYGGVEDAVVTGIMTLSIIRAQNRMVRTLLIRKMRETAIDLVEYQFVIMKEKGIVLKPIF